MKKTKIWKEEIGGNDGNKEEEEIEEGSKEGRKKERTVEEGKKQKRRKLM